MVHLKTLRQRDVMAFCISAIVAIDSLAAGASVGPSVLFWWLFLGVAFFLPYGLISAELGCSFPEQGGIYAWVRNAHGQRWAARVTWIYWINVAVWLPAILISFSAVFAQIFQPDLSLSGQIALGIALTWLVVGINVVTLSLGKWIPNLGAAVKLLVLLVIIIGAIQHGSSNPLANDFNAATLLPSLGDGIIFLPTLIICLLGFELVSAGSDEMRNPARDIPKSILLSGLLIICLYTLASGAMLVAIPAAEINLVEGLMDTLGVFLGTSELALNIAFLLGIGVLYALFSTGATWALGSNRAAVEAARAGELPKIFALETRIGTPIGPAVMLGIASTLVLLLYGSMAGNNEDLFWTLYACSSVVFLMPYVLMCTAFVTLRRRFPEHPRPFRFPGSERMATAGALITAVILLCTITLFCFVPGEGVQWSVLLGALALTGVGEIIIRRKEHNQLEDS